MKNQINIGFIGGCAITQHNITRQNRFYSIFQKKIADKKLYRPVFSFTRYTDYNYLKEACDEVMNKSSLDLLIIHIRPQPFYILSKLLIKYRRKINRNSICINPLLLSKIIYRKFEINPPNNLNQSYTKPRFMDINILLGNIFSLRSKASSLIYNEISSIRSLCIDNNIKLVVLGIPYQPLSWIGNINCHRLNLFLKEKFKNDNVEYLDCYDKMKDKECFHKDKLHFSNKGHYVLGSILYEGLKHFTTANHST